MFFFQAFAQAVYALDALLDHGFYGDRVPIGARRGSAYGGVMVGIAFATYALQMPGRDQVRYLPNDEVKSASATQVRPLQQDGEPLPQPGHQPVPPASPVLAANVQPAPLQ